MDFLVDFENEQEAQESESSFDVLDLFEAQMGHYSLRKHQEAALLRALDLGLSMESSDPDLHAFTINPYWQAVFNHRNEVVIGEHLYVASTVDSGFLVPLGDPAAIAAIRKVGSIAAHIHPSIQPVHSGPTVATNSATSSPTGTGQVQACSLAFELTRSGVCNSLEYSIFMVMVDSSTGMTQSNITYRIDWGDGTIESTNNTSTSHTFPSLGTYMIEVDAFRTGNSADCGSVVSRQLVISPTDCQALGREVGPVWYYAGNHAFRCKLWALARGGGSFSNYPIGASTEHFEWINNSWKKRDVDQVVVQVTGTHYDESCGNSMSVQLAEWKNDGKKARRSTQVGRLFAYLEDGIRSNHRIRVGGVYYEGNLVVPYYC